METGDTTPLTPSRTQSHRLAAIVPVVLSLVVVLASIVAAALNPLRRSPDIIEQDLLRITSLGIAEPEARRIIRASWPELPPYADPGNTYHGDSSGFLKQEPGRRGVVVGDTSARAYLGWYWSFWYILRFRTDVTAFWGFDSDGRLIEVWVWKTTDAP